MQALQIFPQLIDLFPQLVNFFRGCILFLQRGPVGLLRCGEQAAGSSSAKQKEWRKGQACSQAKPGCPTYFAGIVFFCS
jgi:hypothetical protein